MPSQTFYCPHCRRQLTKSAQAYVLGEAIAQKSIFIGLGEMAPYVTCPGCGGRIDSMKMVKGEYDLHPTEQKYFWIFLLGMAAGIPFFRFVVKWSWVASIFVGLIAGVMLGAIILEIIKSSGKGKKY